MSAVNNDDYKEYLKLVKRFALRPIRNEEQNMRAAVICDTLTDRINSLSVAEHDYLEILTDLVSKYESKWDKEAAQMSPRELIQYLMEQNELTQKDLIPELGSASRVSEFLKGDRRLSIEQAKRLTQRFRLNIASLIEVAD
jgi:HTH-type transcriptional regulator/antitoxin HigA